MENDHSCKSRNFELIYKLCINTTTTKPHNLEAGKRRRR